MGMCLFKTRKLRKAQLSPSEAELSFERSMNVCIRLHGVTSLKTLMLVVTAVRSSDLTIERRTI
jgi:hypothetical protein